MGVEDQILGEVVGVVVLEDTTDLNIGQGESFGHIFQAARLDDQLVKSTSIEADDAAVGFDGAGMDVDDTALILEKGDLNIGVLAALFGQNLDAEVNVLVSRETAVVAVDLPEKNNGRRSGSFGLAGHLQFLLRDRLKVHCPGRRHKHGRGQKACKT